MGVPGIASEEVADAAGRAVDGSVSLAIGTAAEAEGAVRRSLAIASA